MGASRHKSLHQASSHSCIAAHVSSFPITIDKLELGTGIKSLQCRMGAHVHALLPRYPCNVPQSTQLSMHASAVIIERCICSVQFNHHV